MTEVIRTSDTIIKKRNKRRKDFYKNAKKYAKKGQLGRGTKIAEDLYQYFLGIVKVIREGEITEKDARRSLVDNVLEKTKGEELNIVGNQLGCRVIEMLLPDASTDDLERYMDVLSPELRKLCTDNFSSHVVEHLLKVSFIRATEHLQENDEPAEKKIKTENEAYEKEHRKKCYEFTLKVSKYALNNLEDFVWDSYANHILRTSLKCLSGIEHIPGDKIKNSFNKKLIQHNDVKYRIVPDEFKEVAIEYVNRLSSWPQFKDLPSNTITSGLVQVLLYAVSNVDKKLCSSVVKKLTNESFAPDDWIGVADDEKKKQDSDINNLPPVFSSSSAIHVLEVALSVARKKTYTQLYARCFMNRLPLLATTPVVNFTVQRLFDNCSIKEEFEPMFDELSDKFENILLSKNGGVILSIAKACQRLKSKQTQFVASLEKALKCTENEKYFPIACLRLLPVNEFDMATLDKSYPTTLFGSIILQTILNFQRPAKVVNGLLELSADELLVVFKDMKGCHVADAFFKGEFVGVKSRHKMMKKLKGYYQSLALDQYGSRVFEVIFENSLQENRISIMEEISYKSKILSSTNYGQIISNTYNVELFKKSQEKWVASLSKKEKAKEIFKDIVISN